MLRIRRSSGDARDSDTRDIQRRRRGARGQEVPACFYRELASAFQALVLDPRSTHQALTSIMRYLKLSEARRVRREMVNAAVDAIRDWVEQEPDNTSAAEIALWKSRLPVCDAALNWTLVILQKSQEFALQRLSQGFRSGYSPKEENVRDFCLELRLWAEEARRRLSRKVVEAYQAMLKREIPLTEAADAVRAGLHAQDALCTEILDWTWKRAQEIEAEFKHRGIAQHTERENAVLKPLREDAIRTQTAARQSLRLLERRLAQGDDHRQNLLF